MVRVCVVVLPKSSKNEIVGFKESPAGLQELSLHVTAAPESGKATNAACKLLADALGLPKSKVSCIRGHTSRHKQFEVDCDPAAVDALAKSF